MGKVRDTASVAPSTITDLSTGALAPAKRRRSCPTGTLPSADNLRCIKVDPRIMAWLTRHRVEFNRVEVRSETEVVVRNQRVR